MSGTLSLAHEFADRSDHLTAALRQILDLHAVNDPAAVVPCCEVCEELYPCATAQIAQESLATAGRGA